MNSTLPLLLTAVFLAGCQSTPTRTTADGRTLRHDERSVRVESVPPGARIFLGQGYVTPTARESRGYVGTAPCEMVVRADTAGGWKIDGIFLASMAVSPTAVITAELNGETREQVFHSGALGRPADKVPQAILFDFTRPAVPSTPAR